MRKNTLLIFIFFLSVNFSYTSYAQKGNATTGDNNADILISGVLLEEGTELPLSFAAVSVYVSSDSSNLSNTTTDLDGNFELRVAPGTYYLVFQYLGFQTKTLSDIVINESQSELNLGKVYLIGNAVDLGVVEVEAERSQMQLKLDKRVFNVGKDLTGAGNTAADILNNVPSVNVDPEGNVSLRGSQGVRILIDGKPSALLSAGDINALQRMQGDIIESVEVITNPSSRYEAEGEAGIINIILKKNKKKGINGSFGATAGYPENYGASYNLNYRQSDLNFFSNFGINYRKNPGGGEASQQFFEDGILTENYTTETDQSRGGIGGNIQLGVDWFVNPRNTITGALLYQRSRDINIATVTYKDFNLNTDETNTTLRESDELSNNQNFEFDLNYRRTFPQKDREWTVDFKHILDDDLELTDYVENYSFSPEPLFQRSSNTEYETNTLFQSDYIHPFNDSTKIEFGTRAALRTIKNDFLVEEINPTGEYEPLPSFDDELKYTENIYAAYFIGARDFGKIGVQVGLRGELSDVNATLLKSQKTIPQNYFNLFPSASVSYQFSLKNQLQVSYSRRLSRPYFRLLLPFSNFNDPRNNRVGNPGLRPEYTDSYEIGFLTYLDKGSFLSSVYHRHTDGVIERLTLPADDGTTIQYPTNLSTRNAYGLEVNFSYDLLDWWKINTDLNFYQAEVNGSFEEVDYSAEIFSWSGRANATFDLAKSVKLQTTFDYQAPENNTQGRTLARYSLDIGASVDVLAGKGTVTLSGRDLFNTRIQRRIIDLPDFKAESEFQWRQTRQVVLNFVYRLNQDSQNIDKDGDIISDEDGF